MMADGLAATMVIALGVNLFFICEQQLQHQYQVSQQKLAVIRLGKEVSDLYAIKKEQVSLSRKGLVANATAQKVSVYYKDNCLWQVTR
ncbi:hypothetical protein H5S09_08215 [Limosilactobacillus sp. STM2_1]|uniref:Competence protein ComGE n=2 Tax=Limosilactobacillus rudii TaxID=2759755 RepID=A0A7W3ULR8_9LACO|nr:hypothetical protein [Limosilactobacillus rudii]MBB1097917.1 hypothetical protein [Limosilactobacillus rudii]